MVNSYDPDVASDANDVRLMISDTDTTAGSYVFEDSEIARFLALNGGSVLLAAAQALEVIAVNEALVLKVIQRLDLKTDGAKLANSLQAQAAAWRQQVDDDADLDWAELVTDPFSARERLTNQMLRSL